MSDSHRFLYRGTCKSCGEETHKYWAGPVYTDGATMYVGDCGAWDCSLPIWMDLDVDASADVEAWEAA